MGNSHRLARASVPAWRLSRRSISASLPTQRYATSERSEPSAQNGRRRGVDLGTRRPDANPPLRSSTAVARVLSRARIFRPATNKNGARTSAIALTMWAVRVLVLAFLVMFAGCGGSDAEQAQPTTSPTGTTSTTTAAVCGEEDAERRHAHDGGRSRRRRAARGRWRGWSRPRPPAQKRLLLLGSLREEPCQASRERARDQLRERLPRRRHGGRSPPSCGAVAPNGSSWPEPQWVERRRSSPQRRSTRLV